jgi:hypothetical protein
MIASAITDLYLQKEMNIKYDDVYKVTMNALGRYVHSNCAHLHYCLCSVARDY